MNHDPEAAGRRIFLRRLGGRAVESAGRLAGLSGAMRRSVVVAAAAVARDLEPAPTVETIVDPAMPASGTIPPPEPVPALLPPPRWPALSLTPEREAFLRSARSGILAVNDPGRAPHISRVVVTWVDEVFRMPSAMFTARANAVDRDPLVSLLVEDPEPGGGRWIMVAGVAALEPDPMSADRAVIIIRPTRIMWQIG